MRIFGVFLVLVHLLVVASLLKQPLDINGLDPVQSAPQRSLTWALSPDASHRKGPGADFFGVYSAGIQPRNDRDIYVDIADPKGPGAYGVPYGYPFRYLPLVAQGLSPVLRLLSPEGAYRAWIVVLELVLGLCLFVLWKTPLPRNLKSLGSAVLLLNVPYFLELHMGQFTFLADALTLGGLLAVQEGGTLLALLGGLAFASATALKLFPAVVSPPLLRTRRGPWLLAITAGTIVLASAAYFAVHPEALAAFAKVNSGGDMSGLDAGNHGFLYLVYRVTHDLGLHWSPRAWSTLGIVWTLLLLGTTATATFLADEASVVLRGALLLMAFVLSYLHVWEHHYSGMVLAGLVVVAELYRRDGGWSRRVRWAAAFLVLLAAPTPFALLDPHPDPAVWDPSTHWPAGTAYLLPLCKVLPLWGLYALGMSALLERLRVAQAFEALGLGPSKRVV